MNPDDFIAAARELVPQGKGSPRQVFLRRAVSTIYYALFHCLARNAADLLVGGPGAVKHGAAWTRAYRALDHGRAKNIHKEPAIRLLPTDIQDFALNLADFQQKRHAADYDPSKRFIKASVLQDIDAAEDLIRRFNSASVMDRRAFVAFVCFPQRQ
ncbi:hypothetical protein [uncultured Rhodospira sp.]|uniref:hypothetical protein n=1 Tax=uncultured Rhodospira sp. TaxID=1936189 RepID=UPI0026220A62|nr:hypothetical protein [uncultured Rhodospira sp.]